MGHLIGENNNWNNLWLFCFLFSLVAIFFGFIFIYIENRKYNPKQQVVDGSQNSANLEEEKRN